MICNLPAVKRRFVPEIVLAACGKVEITFEMQESSKMICNLPATARRFAQKMCSAAYGREKITYANARK